MKSVRSLFSKEQVGRIIGAGTWFALWLSLVIFSSPKWFFLGVGNWSDWLYSIGGAIGLQAAGRLGAFIGRAVEGRAADRESTPRRHRIWRRSECLSRLHRPKDR